MVVILLNATPLSVVDKAIGKCWDKQSCGEINTKRMHRVGNQHKHSSTLEHVSYNFDIDGISRACLQELARHRMSSFSVKSSRYTLEELKNANDYTDLFVSTGQPFVDESIAEQLHKVQVALKNRVPNDIAKYMLPEAYKTSLIWSVNMRSLQNFLELRTNPRALWEIRELAYKIYEQLPEDNKFMFKEFVYEEKDSI